MMSSSPCSLPGTLLPPVRRLATFTTGNVLPPMAISARTALLSCRPLQQVMYYPPIIWWSNAEHQLLLLLWLLLDGIGPQDLPVMDGAHTMSQ